MSEKKLVKPNQWRFIAIILIIIIVISLFYFLIKGFLKVNYITLSKLQYGKKDMLNNLLMINNQSKKFKKGKLQMNQFAEILWAGYGITKKNQKTVFTLLNYPLNIYICVDFNDVDHLKHGLYLYRSKIHNLKRVQSAKVKSHLRKILKLKKEVPPILIITAKDIAYQKDKEKVYFETGQVISQILLKTRQLNLKVRFIKNFDIVKIMNVLDLEEDIPIMVFLIGK